MNQIPLHKDQINSDRFAQHVNFLYSSLPDGHDEWEDKIKLINPNLKKFSNKDQLPEKGVILHRGNMSIKRCFDNIPTGGSYILIARDRDYSLTKDIFDLMPKSIKKCYTINTTFKNNIIEPIPVGCATSGGYSRLLDIISEEPPLEKFVDKLIYCRLTLTRTKEGEERVKLISDNKNNPIFNIQLQDVGADVMYNSIKQHVFTACPAGEGKDCLRTNETICLGGIPIWSDCPELRHFEDFPVVYTKDWNNITKEWCDNALIELKNRKTSTDRLRMSYWDNHIKQSIKDFL